MRPGEVAVLLGVSPKTVTRWAREGKLQRVITLGGHSRFLRSQIEELMAANGPPSEGEA